MTTPPVLVRLAVLVAYVYVWFLGVMSMTTHDVDYATWALVGLTSIYLVDAGFAACPLHWCNMRSIPPHQIMKHHLPVAFALLPNLFLLLLYNDEFTDVLVRTPIIITGIAAGSMTSSNEALWVASSFFSTERLQSKAYKVAQKLSSVVALSEFIFITGWSAGNVVLELAPAVFIDPVRTTLFFTFASFFAIVPFVQVRFAFVPALSFADAAQIPLLIGAVGRLWAELL